MCDKKQKWNKLYEWLESQVNLTIKMSSKIINNDIMAQNLWGKQRAYEAVLDAMGKLETGEI